MPTNTYRCLNPRCRQLGVDVRWFIRQTESAWRSPRCGTCRKPLTTILAGDDHLKAAIAKLDAHRDRIKEKLS